MRSFGDINHGKRPAWDVQRPTLNLEPRFRMFLPLDVQYSMLDVRRFRADL